MGERVLVTGGAGFIGSHIVDALLEKGDDVRVLDNMATGFRENIAHVSDSVDLIEGDLLSYERVHNAVRGCDLVLHMGALPSVPRSIQDPITSTSVNIMGTLNVLLTARDEGVRRVVYASSSSVYGANPKLPKVETMRPMPVSPYASAKLSGEALCSTFDETYGVETVSLRFFNVFGPRQNPSSEYSAVIPKFITALSEGRKLTIFGDGSQSRDFTFVKDVVSGVIAASTAPNASGEVFNIAGGKRHSLLDLVGALEAVMGVDADYAFAPTRPGDVPHSMADVSRAAEVLGWKAQYDLRSGLEHTVEWLRIP